VGFAEVLTRDLQPEVETGATDPAHTRHHALTPAGGSTDPAQQLLGFLAVVAQEAEIPDSYQEKGDQNIGGNGPHLHQ
jgi:hypothetical protein